jgi:hypothetical protein
MNLPLSIALAAALTIGARGQDAPLKTAPINKPSQNLEVIAPPPPRTNSLDTNVLSNPKLPKESTVSFGGLIPEVRKSTNRWRIFSLRRPANLKDDEANLVRNVRTEASPAVRVFSVDF